MHACAELSPVQIVCGEVTFCKIVFVDTHSIPTSTTNIMYNIIAKNLVATPYTNPMLNIQ